MLGKMKCAKKRLQKLFVFISYSYVIEETILSNQCFDPIERCMKNGLCGGVGIQTHDLSVISLLP